MDFFLMLGEVSVLAIIGVVLWFAGEFGGSPTWGDLGFGCKLRVRAGADTHDAVHGDPWLVTCVAAISTRACPGKVESGFRIGTCANSTSLSSASRFHLIGMRSSPLRRITGVAKEIAHSALGSSTVKANPFKQPVRSQRQPTQGL
jgi:hypothetical protein